MEGKPLETDVKADTPADVKPAEAAHAPADVPLEPNAPNVPAIEASALPQEEIERLTADIVAALKTVFDPEIPSDIYELGLIYKVDISDEREVAVLMTLTAPGCPVAGEMPKWVEDAVNAVPGVKETKVTLTFDPPWDQSRMSDEARLALNMF
jgi:FeS assembly SUF system protein